MTEDRLKDFIDFHRHEFDEIEQTDLGVLWNEIKKDKDEKPKSIRFVLIGFIIGLLAVIALLWMSHQKTNEKLNHLEHFVMSSPQYKTKHEELMIFVKDKESKVETAEIEPSEYQEIFNELNELELLKKDIEKDFVKYGDTDELMKTLFKHYERKAKILELLLFENEKNKYNESMDYSRTY